MKKPLLKIIVFVFCLGFSGTAWSQEDEFNLEGEAAATPTAPATSLPGEEDLSLPTDPSSAAPQPLTAEPTLESEPTAEQILSTETEPAPVPAEPTPEPTPAAPITVLGAPKNEVPKTEIAIPRELPPKNMDPIHVGDSSPDLRKEEEFNRIYKKYNESPTNIEAWEKVIGARSSESYQIQKNDTLWDLSKTLFGDPNYWPKVWFLNKESVYNPHQINPKLNLTFYPGTKTQPPTLGVTDKPVPEQKEATVPAESADPAATVTKSEVGSSSQTPEEGMSTPRSRVKVPVIKKLPPSLPEYSVVGIVKPKLEVDLRPKLDPNPSLYLPYYITDQALNEVGEVKETEIGIASAFEFQYIFVQVQDPSQKVYTVVREFSTIPLAGESSAKNIEIQGEIELVNKVDNETNLHRALVKKSLQRVEVGSKLLVGSMPKINSSFAAEKSGAHSKIIGGQYGFVNEIYSASNFVFLDQGSSQGYKINDVLPIYASYGVRNSKTAAKVNERKIGLIKIVKVFDSVSTGYILKTFEDIKRGDIVGSMSESFTEVSKSDGENLDLDESATELQNQAPVEVPKMDDPEEGGTGEDELTL